MIREEILIPPASHYPHYPDNPDLPLICFRRVFPSESLGAEAFDRRIGALPTAREPL